ncbi:MAG: hypothetical protein Q7W02_27895 [Candidatus Rokubacteria bacterium]|nr:hypothetical protein [Candidatus Rokubacteria bacterium]
MNWATHDGLTHREIAGLCRQGCLGRVPVIRHFAGVLAVEARRRGAPAP